MRLNRTLLSKKYRLPRVPPKITSIPKAKADVAHKNNGYKISTVASLDPEFESQLLLVFYRRRNCHSSYNKHWGTPRLFKTRMDICLRHHRGSSHSCLLGFVFNKQKSFTSFNKWSSLADVIIMGWATDVGEYPTYSLRVLGHPCPYLLLSLSPRCSTHTGAASLATVVDCSRSLLRAS